MVFSGPGDPLFPEKPEIELPPLDAPGIPDSGRSPQRPSPDAEPSLPPQPGNPVYPRYSYAARPYSAPRDQSYLFRDMNF